MKQVKHARYVPKCSDCEIIGTEFNSSDGIADRPAEGFISSIVEMSIAFPESPIDE
jgi:hypothetical protein